MSQLFIAIAMGVVCSVNSTVIDIKNYFTNFKESKQFYLSSSRQNRPVKGETRQIPPPPSGVISASSAVGLSGLSKESLLSSSRQNRPVKGETRQIPPPPVS